MTPTQRRELERLIDERVYAALSEAAKYGFAGAHDEALQQRCRETYGDLMHYLDSLTDYSAAEAVTTP